MNLTQHLLLLVILLSGASSWNGRLFAQSEWEKKGDNHYQEGAFQDAIGYYEWAAKRDPSTSLLIKLGDCYRQLNSNQKALKTYERVKPENIADPEFFLHYAQTLMLFKNYEAAKVQLNNYRNYHPDDLRIQEYLNLLKSPDVLYGSSDQYEILPVSFNSDTDDFSPVLHGEGIMFVSARNNDWGVVHISEGEKSPLLDIFVLDSIPPSGQKLRKKNQPVPLPGEVNTRFHEGPFCLNKSGTTMYFTRNNFQDKKSGKEGNLLKKLKIFRAELVNGNWSKITDLPINDDNFANAHPALSVNDDFMIFASDRPGGFGGTDLYMVTLKNGQFGEIINLGEEVNTPGDEVFPYLYDQNKLYFSSDGHAGMGGLDLFSAEFNSGKFSKIKHLNYPLNSSMDDFGIALRGNGKSGFLSSNRGKGLHDNIFEFYIQRPQFECEEQQEIKYCFTFYEASGADKDADILKYYQWDLGDGTKIRSPEIYHCYDKPGVYEVKLNVLDSITGKVAYEETSDLMEVKKIRQPYIRGPEKGKVGHPLSFDAQKTYLKGVDIEDYHWDFGDGVWKTGETATHTYLKPGTYQIKLGVKGYDKPGEKEVHPCVFIPVEIIDAKTEFETIECNPQQINAYCHSFDEDKPLDFEGLPMVYEWSFGDEEKQRGLKAEHCYPGPGLYLARLNVIDTLKDRLFFNEARINVRLKNHIQPYIHGPEFFEANKPSQMDAYKSTITNCVIDNYSWEFGDGSTADQALVTHAYQTPGEYEIKLTAKGHRPTNDQPCTACVTRKIKVLPSIEFVSTFPKGVPDTDVPGTVLSQPLPELLAVSEIEIEEEYDIAEVEDPTYALQILASPTPIPITSPVFKNLKNIKERKTEIDYSYTIEEEKSITNLYFKYNEVLDLGFSSVMVVALDHGVVVSGHDSTYFVNIPGYDGPISMSVVEGILTDFNGKPLKAEIVWEDLTNGKIYSTSETDESGHYYLELENGKLYGFFAKKQGFYPISDYIDLRDEEEGVTYEGKIQIVSPDEATNGAIRLNNLFFTPGSHELQKESFKEIDRLVVFLRENPAAKVEVIGHTDNIGNDNSNLELSRRRANAVLRYMLSHGLSIDKMTSTGYGETQPVATNDTPEGRAQNRRVEIRFFTD